MSIHELLNRDIKCSCGRTHRCDIETVEIGNNTLNKLPNITNNFKSILLVADNNTFPLCGEKVKNLLNGSLEGVCIYDTPSHLVPDEKAIKILESYLTDKTDLILGIGSGVINDLCKYVSFYRGIKSGIIATAPSMDGYASSGAAMIIGGMKVTYTTHAPDIIIGDTDILKTAPIDMIRAGYGDIIGKYSSLCDWELAALVCKEHFCKMIYDVVMDTVNEIRDAVSDIVLCKDTGIEKLMRALVLSGMTLTLAETTRPGSGSEHHLSHFFEIVGLIRNEKHLPHGTDVAYNTILTAGIREQILKMDTPEFCEESKEDRENAWERIYASVAGEVKTLQDEAKSYETDLKPIYTGKWVEIKKVLSKCPTADECNKIMEAVGLNFTQCESLYGQDKIRDAMLYGKDLKNRYSVLWLYYSLFSGNPQAVDYKTFGFQASKI